MPSSREVQRFLHEKREKRRLDRLRAKRGKSSKRSPIPASSSGLIAFREHAAKKSPKGKTKEIRIAVPGEFSVIDNPELVLDVIYDLVEQNDKYLKVRKIHFDHSELRDYDLAAEQMMDHLAAEIGRERIRQKPRLNMGGTFPLDESASRFIRGIGIIQTLGIEDRYMTAREKESLEIFEKMDNNALRQIRRASDKTPRDSAVQRFTDHIDNCLRRLGHQLTPDGRHELGVVSGEVIDNAVQHSEGDGWVIAGYLDTNHPDNICEIAIFNFGKSIAETLADLPSDHFTSKLIQPYIHAHSKKGYFGSGWTEEQLLTLVALQENVSCKNHSSDDTRGGGTVDLIEFFQQIYEECGSKCASKPRMAILSGRTHITFDGKYQIQPDSSGRPVIAFNEKNRLDLAPDKSYFKRMNKRPFPGTAVSIRFPLQEYQYEATRDVQ